MAARKPQRRMVEPAALAAARRDYETTSRPTREIAAELGITVPALQGRVVRDGWKRRPRFRFGRRAGAAEVDTATQPKPPRKVKPTGRAAQRARISRTIAKQLDLIDAILSQTRQTPSPAAERTARTLASLTRTLRELAQLGAEQITTQEADDDAPPRDINEFRKELAERLDRIVADAARGGADENS